MNIFMSGCKVSQKFFSDIRMTTKTVVLQIWERFARSHRYTIPLCLGVLLGGIAWLAISFTPFAPHC